MEGLVLFQPGQTDADAARLASRSRTLALLMHAAEGHYELPGSGYD
jgi:hypothetical protein